MHEAVRGLLSCLSGQQDAPMPSLQAWEPIIRLARAADVMGRLAAMVRQAGRWTEVPEPVLAHLTAAELVTRRQHLELDFEVQEIMGAIRPLGVQVVLLKGAAYILGGLDAGLGRTVSDVDILVPGADLDRVESALLAAGWSSSGKSNYDQRYYRQWMHELPPMVHIRRGTVVDVHHAILPRTARVNPSSALLLDASVPVRGGYRMLCDADMVLHSATHLMHEGSFEQGFRGLLDLQALIRASVSRTGEAFWVQLVLRAQRLSLCLPMWQALRQLQRHLDEAVPAACLDGLVAAEPGGAEGWRQKVLDACFDRVLVPQHPMLSDAWTPWAQKALYIRGHWLRMPPALLLVHLARKGLGADERDGRRGA
jgi:Uncharacterised nucleotidyltransferase